MTEQIFEEAKKVRIELEKKVDNNYELSNAIKNIKCGKSKKIDIIRINIYSYDDSNHYSIKVDSQRLYDFLVKEKQYNEEEIQFLNEKFTQL